MDSVPSCRKIKRMQDLICIWQKQILLAEGHPMSLPEGNDDYEKN